MGTLTGLMSLARHALDADQQAINVTSNNVANQNTVGYTRQTVSFSATDSVSLNGFQGNGEGADVTVTSQRDRVLEQRLQQTTQAASASGSRLSALQDVEQMFGLSSTDTNASATTLGSAVDGFFASLTALAANPTDAATKTAVLTAAQSLASAFHTAASGLQSETSDLNAQIGTSASQINALTSTVAQLNQQITSLSPGQDAGALEDSRQQAIKQLSTLVGVNQIATENNGVTLTLSSGAVLVSGNASFAVSTSSVGGNTELVAGQPATVQASLQGGSIGGMMQARDNDIPAMMSSLDTLANGIASAVNAQNAAGITSSGVAGSAIFSLPVTVAGSAEGLAVVATSSNDLASAGSTEGTTGSANAAALAALSNASIEGGESASEFFASFIGALGSTVSSATTDNAAQTAALTQAQTQRDAFSGVSLDEEASSLTQYQRSYEAAAKVFDIVNQLFASVLNLGEETTVS